MTTLSPNRTRKEAADWINWLGWSGFNGAKGFSREWIGDAGTVSIDRGSLEKGFVSNEIDFFSVKPEFYRRR
jgi:hypothetical protein